MSAIFDNALDSLQVGVSLCVSADQDRMRKHAILTVFQSIELMLKEYLYQANPILIYKNIDKKITDDSLSVGFPEILMRLENLQLDLPDEQAEVIHSLQSKRNRIEHHGYQHTNENRELITEALKFTLYFMKFQLKKPPAEYLEPKLLKEILFTLENSHDWDALADHHLESWLGKKWPSWDRDLENKPAEFSGTDTCPKCRNDYLVMGHMDKPYCFWCCSEVLAEYCDFCGEIKIIGDSCCDSNSLPDLGLL